MNIRTAGKDLMNEISLPDKKAIYSALILENISDEDYIHAQRVFKEF